MNIFFQELHNLMNKKFEEGFGYDEDKLYEDEEYEAEVIFPIDKSSRKNKRSSNKEGREKRN
jgi:hypothetical protein